MLLKMIRRLQKRLPVDNAVFFMLKEPDMTDNIYYLLQKKISPAVLVIPKKGKAVIYIAGFEYDRFKNALPIQVKKFSSLKGVLQNINGSIGYDATEVSAKIFQRIKPYPHKDISTLMSNLRIIKQPWEIAHLKKAAQITAKIFKELFKNRFTHEKDIRTFLLRRTIEEGAKPAFSPIVASGKGATEPHYAGAKPLRKGFCVIDYGVRWRGYRADISRTIFVGVPTAADKALYNKVLQAQSAALTQYRVGITCSKAQEAAEEILGPIPHSVGHGIGLDIHEQPGIGPHAKHTFQEGMVVTCEPGTYKKQGIRIEDDYVITKRGPQLLAPLNNELIVWK
jgi:Xaa-Pro aminopeptidase